jgi:hypothetical protein
MSTLTIPTIAVAESVWDDFLSPDASSMETELGLAECRAVPFYRKAGKGGRRVYRNVPQTIALELAEYLEGRGGTLLAQGVQDPYDEFEKASRATYRRAIKLAGEIRSAEQRERVLAADDAMMLDVAAQRIARTFLS